MMTILDAETSEGYHRLDIDGKSVLSKYINGLRFFSQPLIAKNNFMQLKSNIDFEVLEDVGVV